MQASKKNTNRKRKERPLTSYFAAVATVPVVVRAPAAALSAAVAVVDEQQDKSDGIGDMGFYSVESTTPAIARQQSTKGRILKHAASAKEKKHQQEPAVAVGVVTSSVPAGNVEVKCQSSDSTDRRSTTNKSSGNENAVEALQDCTNASSAGVELEEATSKQAENGHTVKPEKKSSAAMIRNHTTSRSRSLPPSINVVHQLLSRSMHGAGRTKCSVVSAPPPAWKIPSWIDLCPGNSSARNSGIKSLAWDEMGVLLAAYCDDRCIRIYDWDMVVAANVKGRNRRTRQAAYNKKDTECLMIEPILIFPFPFGHVSVLKWNPFHPDELAVATRCVLLCCLRVCFFCTRLIARMSWYKGALSNTSFSCCVSLFTPILKTVWAVMFIFTTLTKSAPGKKSVTGDRRARPIESWQLPKVVPSRNLSFAATRGTA
jgi:hypothetical protein